MIRIGRIVRLAMPSDERRIGRAVFQDCFRILSRIAQVVAACWKPHAARFEPPRC
jgi:hypothetical protein